MINALGLELESAFRTPEGKIVRAQLTIGTGRIFVGPGMVPFGTHGVHDPDAVSSALYVYVDDLDAHFARAKANGARILAEISEKPHGDRIYVASDPQGQRWTFARPK